MKSKIIKSAMLILAGGSLLAAWALADDSKPTEPTTSAGGNLPPCCQQMMQKGGMNMTNMMSGMMQGMTPETMERMQLLMRVPIFLDAPCPIFAQAEKLGLNDEQKKKLGEIENEARAKARAVLTPEQQAKLGSVPDKPVTMMESCPMMKMMQGMQQGQKNETDKTK